MTIEREAKPRATRARTPKRPKETTATALDRLQPCEQALVLRTLLARHTELRPEAESLAAEMLSTASAAGVAEEVRDLVGRPDIDDLNARTGDHGWGYVPPEEAADEILREAIADHVDDMKRKAAAGFVEAAATVCEGIIAGLYQARMPRTGSVLDWSPDFPLDAAVGVIGDLRRASAAEVRDAATHRVMKAAAPLAPEWAQALERAAHQK